MNTLCCGYTLLWALFPGILKFLVCGEIQHVMSAYLFKSYSYKKPCGGTPSIKIYREIPKHRSHMGLFCGWAKIFRCSPSKIVKNYLFARKICKNGYLFLPKWLLKMGKGFEAWAAHPIQIKSEKPQGKKYTIKLHTANFELHTANLEPIIQTFFFCLFEN